jgi:DNA-binding NtrC family response regulator
VSLLFNRADTTGFDLVITDQARPDMTGIELAKEMHSVRPDLPVILSIDFSHFIDAVTAKAAGVRAFALKPLTRGEIARVVRKALDG